MLTAYSQGIGKGDQQISFLSSTERNLGCVLFRRWHYFSHKYKIHQVIWKLTGRWTQRETQEIFVPNLLYRSLSILFTSGPCITLLQMRLTNDKVKPCVYCGVVVKAVFYLLSVLRASQLWKGELFRMPQPLRFRVLSKILM